MKPDLLNKLRLRKLPERRKQRIVEERGFETIHTLAETLAEFSYQPVVCKRAYRIVVLRKLLATDKYQMRLFQKYRYFFFITNDRKMTDAFYRRTRDKAYS